MRTVVRICGIAALAVPLAGSIRAQSWTVSGHVSDAVSGDLLPATTVRVLGTSRGTIANARGDFQLSLEQGSWRLVYSYVGYRSDTVDVDLRKNLRVDVRLEPSAVPLPEVIVTGEDPAVAIMRAVIEGKKRWQERLHSYRFDAFTRQVLWRDTAIASITESYSLGYWKQGDTLREVIRQKRQTQNVPVGQNFASVGTILNFYEDDIRFAGFSFVGPTSPEAFSYYDFHLERIRMIDGRQVFVIALQPTSHVTPLFRGTVNVLDEEYTLVGVDVEPNDAFVLPLISTVKLQYSQQFRRYDNDYWLPVDIRVDGTFDVGIPGVSLPRLRLQSSSSIYDYRVNITVPDSVARQPRRFVREDADRLDSAFWSSHAVLPLTPVERDAYEHLDSTQTLDRQLKAGGPLAALGSLSETPIRFLDLRFNRVEGLFLGADVESDSIGTRWKFHVAAGYGFNDRRWKGRVGVTCFLAVDRSVSLEAGVFRDVALAPEEDLYSTFSNTMSTLFWKNDYRDYFYQSGGTLRVRWNPWRRLSAMAGLSVHEDRTAHQTTDFSFFYRRDRFRPNPVAEEGRIHSILASVRMGDPPVPFSLLDVNAVEVEGEHADAGWLGSDFGFTSLRMHGEFHLSTMLTRSFLSPRLTVRISGGRSWGVLPAQYTSSLESNLSGFASFGAFHGTAVKEYRGDAYVAAHVEHNFRSTPFSLLGLSSFVRHAIEIVVFAAAGRTWWLGQLKSPPSGNHDNWYSEAGVGVGRIFGLLRVDVSRRFARPEAYSVTLGLSKLL